MDGQQSFLMTDNMNKSIKKFNYAEENAKTKDTEVLFEPAYQLMENLKYKSRPTRLSYDLMYSISQKVSVVSAIIITRLNQVRQFTRPKYKSVSGLGFSIKPRDWKDRTKPLLRSEKKAIQMLEDFVWYCGVNEDRRRDKFEQFAMKIIKDRLRYDQIGIYKIRDRKDRIHSFKAIDGATLRFAAEDSGYDFVQVIDTQVKGMFNAKDVEMIVTNPDTYIRSYGYGTPELEILIHVITSFLFVEEYNKRYFSPASPPKGIIHFKGDNISQKSLEAFRRSWHAMVSDITNAWRTPITAGGGDIQFISLDRNSDLQFAQFLEYLIKIVCAIYQIDPLEINLMMRTGLGAQQQQSLFQARDYKDKLNMSKDRGLIPLLELIADIVNEILAEITEDFVFVLEDLTTEAEEKRIDKYDKKSKIYMTINEIRRENGMEDIENGDIILNPTYTQYLSQQAMMGGEEEGEEGGEMEGEEPEGEENEEELPGGNEDELSNYLKTLEVGTNEEGEEGETNE